VCSTLTLCSELPTVVTSICTKGVWASKIPLYSWKWSSLDLSMRRGPFLHSSCPWFSLYYSLLFLETFSGNFCYSLNGTLTSLLRRLRIIIIRCCFVLGCLSIKHRKYYCLSIVVWFSRLQYTTCFPKINILV